MLGRLDGRCRLRVAITTRGNSETLQAKIDGCVKHFEENWGAFSLIDPNGRCAEMGINTEKREWWALSEWDIWAINLAYGGNNRQGTLSAKGAKI